MGDSHCRPAFAFVADRSIRYIQFPFPPANVFIADRGTVQIPFHRSFAKSSEVTTMCTTSQYLYNCSHPASYRFRTSICRDPASSTCRIRDENSFLPYTCPKCAAKTRTRKGKQADERSRYSTDIKIMVAKKTWHIPSRCFVDAGFQNLDPFGMGIETETANRARPQSPLTPTPGGPLTMDETGISDRAHEHPRHLSPCCLKSSKMGAYQATRLEGVEDRQRGRIMDSLCGSWF